MRKLMLVALFFLFAVAIASAQSDPCPTIVETALQSVDSICSSIDRNSACYGASVLDSLTVVQPRPVDFFDAPGDKAGLSQLREIRPATVDIENGTFGVGVLNLQANIPNTLPGQGVIFLIMGGARLTNEVELTSTTETPFETFYFLPGIGQSDCYEAEPMLTIQTPGNISVKIALNGVETEMSPGTLLTITPDVCTIHRGNIIRRSNGNQAVLLANETVEIFIDDAGAINVTGKRGITEAEYARGEEIQSVLNALADTNGWQEQFLSPPIAFAEEPTPEASIEADSDATATPSACDTQHTVKSGETLHMIAQKYDTSVLDIADANELDNPRVIYPGQVLCIPNPGSGFVALPKGE